MCFVEAVSYPVHEEEGREGDPEREEEQEEEKGRRRERQRRTRQGKGEDAGRKEGSNEGRKKKDMRFYGSFRVKILKHKPTVQSQKIKRRESKYTTTENHQFTNKEREISQAQKYKELKTREANMLTTLWLLWGILAFVYFLLR